MSDKMKVEKNSALLIVDMQNDFLPGGALAVEGGDEIIGGINDIANKFHDLDYPVVYSQDWHPEDHMSFASQYEDKQPGDLIESDVLGPVLWPDHCVQNTQGAEITEKINTKYGSLIIRKGYHREIDSYSVFYENDQETKTGLAGYLKDKNIQTIYICGLALDYCCFFSAMDASKDGFDVVFIKDLTRGIDDPEGNIEKSLENMNNAGIKIVHQNLIEL